METPPRSWQDLWRPDYEGAVTFPSPANVTSVPFGGAGQVEGQTAQRDGSGFRFNS
ncbi:ABC transporter substrate-binding protein [Ochrobactrum pseudogrignonense]|nr:ABC transporter substrate-binding protein [Brucella pseudogrignonensis]